MKKLIIGLMAASLLIFSGCDHQAVEPVEVEPAEEPGEVTENQEQQQVVYMEIGTDPDSTHFEHRVARVYHRGVDGSAPELIFSDLDYPWDLGNVYSVSPDGNKLVCAFFEGGRGAYSSLSILDIETGTLEPVIEFDYTQNPDISSQKQVYGQPVWSPDSSRLAFEIINVPMGGGTEGYTSEWVHIYDLESKTVEQVIPRIGGMCATKLTFMLPVLFLPDGTLVTAYHGFYQEEEMSGSYSPNEEVYLMDLGSGDLHQIMDIDTFEQVEQPQGFSNFKRWQELIVFEVLGDFEEDGDIYSYNIDSQVITGLTSNAQLREQQPDTFEQKLCYVGVPRYGTITYDNPSGNIYLYSEQEHIPVTDYDLGAVNPIFSHSGEHIAYLKYNYDSNYQFLESTSLKVYNVQTGQTDTVIEEKQVIDLAGWTATR